MAGVRNPRADDSSAMLVVGIVVVLLAAQYLIGSCN